jgi:hypothetical protein
MGSLVGVLASFDPCGDAKRALVVLAFSSFQVSRVFIRIDHCTIPTTHTHCPVCHIMRTSLAQMHLHLFTIRTPA